MNTAQHLNIKPVLLFDEMSAYEALWYESDMTFKRMADLFRAHPGSLPSDFVSLEKLAHYKSRLKALMDSFKGKGFGVRLFGSAEYPQKLRDAAHPIELLYYQGWWDLVESPSIAVVGTRNPTEAGKALAINLVSALLKEGYTIVSGLAKGIDTVAHQTAINQGGKTIAVIGTPLSKAYPPENAELQKFIAENFLLISQIPFLRYERQGPLQNRLFFPERNITMSALSLGTLIIEAGETSGTLVQARAALAQGRKLFITEHCFNNPSLTWPKQFEEKGAIRVENVDDIKKTLTS